MSIKDKDITSYWPIVVNKTRLCACKLKHLLLWLVNLEFFFFTFWKKWVSWAMRNETFYWDGLSFHSWQSTLVLPYNLNSNLCNVEYNKCSKSDYSTEKKNVFSVPRHLYLVLSISDQNPGVMGSNPGKVKEFFFTFHGPHFLTSSGNTEKKIKWRNHLFMIVN